MLTRRITTFSLFCKSSASWNSWKNGSEALGSKRSTPLSENQLSEVAQQRYNGFRVEPTRDCKHANKAGEKIYQLALSLLEESYLSTYNRVCSILRTPFKVNI
ncbi:hypothetical protein L596_029744 [Steinernema carpocapsae]|uniref:Uncharacterized protein n=1 Tax=Steinernema carpocapsae TaxID=34508 RepID=A0A4U5LQP5_STECR|nr:hypothetical protein L596_029744 [Steinernema carpocapsae]